MQSRNSIDYVSIRHPFKLHLEFDQLSVGELGRLMSSYQAALRASWRIAASIRSPSFLLYPPTPRVMTISITSGNSIDIIADFAVPALAFSTQILGPVVRWPTLLQEVFEMLASFFRQQNPDDAKAEQIIQQSRIKPGGPEDSSSLRTVERFVETIVRSKVGAEIEIVETRVKVSLRRK